MADQETQEFSTEDLRSTLIGTINDLRAGRINHQDANVICKISAEIIKTADLELRFATTAKELADGDHGIVIGNLPLIEGSTESSVD